MISSNESVQDAIDRACAKLEMTVKDMGVSLAFAPSNISELEEVLLAVRDMEDESALTGACFMVGAYIGEILRRVIGGQWTMSADGIASLQFPKGGDRIFPVEKVRKYVQDPDGESLAFYAQALLARKN
jgi:hypothetical protein